MGHFKSSFFFLLCNFFFFFVLNMAKEAPKGIAVGFGRGFITTKKEKIVKRSHLKGVRSTRGKFVSDLIKEVAGYTPYERRAMELLKVGREKRCLRFLKNRLGTHGRAKAKREYLTDVLQAMRQKGAN